MNDQTIVGNTVAALEKYWRYGKTIHDDPLGVKSAIRSQVPNVVMQDYGKGSETKW